MPEYPTFTDSYTKNQQALLRALGLTSPSQAPFRRIPCFMVYTKETAQTWTPSTTYILTPESEEAESDWLCLAFSVVALHHWDEWPEKDRVDCFDRFRNWQCEIDENDIGFLSQFFAEAWKTLYEQHPSIHNLLEGGRLYLENRFNTETEDGLDRLITWLRWIIESLWSDQEKNCSTKTDADIRALRLIVDLLGEGSVRVIEDGGFCWKVQTWLLQAIHLTRNTGILPGQTHTVMTSYSPGNRIMGPAGRATTLGYSALGFIPFDPKFDKWDAKHFQAQGLQVGFHTYVHPGAHIGNNVTIGHGTIIEAGAYIHDGTHIGSQSYIGVGTHIGSRVNIGVSVRLLDAEPGRLPVVIEDGAILEAGTTVFPDSRVIPRSATLRASIVIRPETVFRNQDGSIIVELLPNISISPSDHHTLIVDTSD